MQVMPTRATTPTRESPRNRLKTTTGPGRMGNDGTLGEVEPKSIALCIVLSLFLSPITFRLVADTTDTGHQYMYEFTAYLLTLAFCVVIIFLGYVLLRQHYQLEQLQVRLKPTTLFSVFSTPSKHNSPGGRNRHYGEQDLRDTKSSPNKRKIDPKYFKPRFILDELMSMWGTTYTVITWGSVWVVGGTIIAGGKLAQKIKTKCTNRDNQPGTTSYGRTQRQNSSDSYATYFSDDSESTTDQNNNTTTNNNKSSLGRLSSWTKKSYASAKKKWNKFTSTANAGALQITTGSPGWARNAR